MSKSYTLKFSRLSILTTIFSLVCSVALFSQSTTLVKKQEIKPQSTNPPQTDLEKKLSVTPGLDIHLNFVIEDDIMKDNDDDKDNSNQEIQTHLNDLNAVHHSNNNNTSENEGIVTNTLGEEKREEVKIFPIPAVSYFNIQLENNTIENYKLLNAAGQVIRSEALNGSKTTVQIQTNDLAKGVYFVVINSDTTPISKSILIH